LPGAKGQVVRFLLAGRQDCLLHYPARVAGANWSRSQQRADSYRPAIYDGIGRAVKETFGAGCRR